MSDRCHWTIEGPLAHFIPGCMGGAVGGPGGCTCDHPLSEIDQEREARREAEECVERLLVKARRREEFNDSMMRENKRLRAELRRLKASSGNGSSPQGARWGHE